MCGSKGTGTRASRLASCCSAAHEVPPLLVDPAGSPKAGEVDGDLLSGAGDWTASDAEDAEDADESAAAVNGVEDTTANNATSKVEPGMEV